MVENEAMNDAKPGQAKRLIDQNLLDACIHCGLCLPACPTYLATGRETESPRGRIYLLNQWQKSGRAPQSRLVEHIDSCLGCLGCQTACPSGVVYEKILNQARPGLTETKPLWKRRVSRFIFEKVLPDYKLLKDLTSLLRIWQRFGGGVFLKVLAKIRFPFAGNLAVLESFLPPIPPFQPLPKQSWNVGKKAGKAQFFSGCVMDVFYGPVNHAALRLMRAQGQIVEVPEQTCCGALAFHAGEVDIAVELAKRNIAAFADKEGPIVVTSAGCGAILKEYGELLEKDESWREAARQFASRVKDVSEFLSEHEFTDHVHRRARAVAAKVAYHAACHLAHAQNVRRAPEKLLNQLLADVEESNKEAPGRSFALVPLVDAEHCCGSAGIFNVLHPDLSLAILKAKMARIKESGADAVVTGNPGCLMQLAAGTRQAAGKPIRVMHLVELLDESYGLAKPDD
jgi:glycolate oxidase iron-sulfur subunit